MKKIVVLGLLYIGGVGVPTLLVGLTGRDVYVTLGTAIVSGVLSLMVVVVLTFLDGRR